MTPETYAAIQRGYLTPEQRAALAHLLVALEATLGIDDEEPTMVVEVFRAHFEEAMAAFDLSEADEEVTS